MSDITGVLSNKKLTRDDIVRLLGCEGDDMNMLFIRAREVKDENVGGVVYLRGLVEFSNMCAKNCLYCGIRLDNKLVPRYRLSVDEIVEAARFAHDNRYASIVLQSGELESEDFTAFVEKMLEAIHRATNNSLRVTLSCGEQRKEVYQRWFDAGAHRYLLRIETSNPRLYALYHPADGRHSHARRMQCLEDLRDCDYQVGTGVMIGLPYQQLCDLADDILFMSSLGIDMVGMGPYVEHALTPLYDSRHQLLPLQQRFDLALKMIAVLRMVMPKINIAASTALQAIDPMGREKAIAKGANVIMPNITPGIYRNNYTLYENKPCRDEGADDCKNCLDVSISLINNTIAYGEWGDSKQYLLSR